MRYNIKNKGAQKTLLSIMINQWAKKNGQKVVPEYRFHPSRLWRLDFAFPDLKTGIEYEGIMSTKSRHTTIKGFTGDCEKYNQAQLLGWKVFRYTALNYGQVTRDLDLILKN